MKKGLIVMGEICSGKDTYAEGNLNAAEMFGIKPIHIRLGDLVREKHNTEERVFDDQLDDYLVSRIREIMEESETDTFVITSIRQVSLLKAVQALFDKVALVYLVVPREILKERYAERDAKKDEKLSFERAIAGDEYLGIKKLQTHLLTQERCLFVNNY